MREATSMGNVAYWLLTAFLIVFGVIAGFSIGQPFLLVGLVLALLAPFRRRPIVFWPILLAVVGFDVGYWAVAPLACTATTVLDSSGTASAGTTVCTSLIGLRYEGTGAYSPPLLPGILAGVVVGLSFAALAAVSIRLQGSPARTA